MQDNRRASCFLVGAGLLVMVLGCELSTVRRKVERQVYHETFVVYRTQTKSDLRVLFQAEDSSRGTFRVIESLPIDIVAQRRPDFQASPADPGRCAASALGSWTGQFQFYVPVPDTYVFSFTNPDAARAVHIDFRLERLYFEPDTP